MTRQNTRSAPPGSQSSEKSKNMRQKITKDFFELDLEFRGENEVGYLIEQLQSCQEIVLAQGFKDVMLICLPCPAASRGEEKIEAFVRGERWETDEEMSARRQAGKQHDKAAEKNNFLEEVKRKAKLMTREELMAAWSSGR
jgi:hypothetical protein